MRMARFTAKVCLVLTFLTTPVFAQAPQLKYLGGADRRILDAQALPNATYSYAPTFVWTGNRLLSWSCVTAPNGAGDAVALTYSDDLMNWSRPGIVFQERVARPNYYPYACDPSVVIVTPAGSSQAHYYLYYGGATVNGGFIAVARSPVSNPAGFQKWLGGNPASASSWTSTITAAPRQVIGPQNPCSSGGGTGACYGAGQPTVVVRDGVFHMWYTDTTAHPMGIWYTTSTDGLNFGPAVVTNVTGGSAASVEVKFDPTRNLYYMFELQGHAEVASLFVRWSVDGVAWSEQTRYGSAPRWSHNVGVTGNILGHFVWDKPFFVGYGAPNDLHPAYNNECRQCSPLGWAHWDLFMTQVVVGPLPPSSGRPVINVYRYFSGLHHFYTTSLAEGSSTGWQFEGAAFQLAATGGEGTYTVMRCRLRSGGLHFLSRDPGCEGQLVDGPIGYLLTTPVATSQEVFRCNRDRAFLQTTHTSECLANGYGTVGSLGFTP